MARPRSYYKTPHFRLEQWADAGDLRAEFELTHRRTVQQMVYDVTADPQTSVAPHDYRIHLSSRVRLYFCKADVRVILSMQSEEPLSRREFTRHYDAIETWKARLHDWQVNNSEEHRLLTKMRDRQGRGQLSRVTSYATRAAAINAEIAGSLSDFATQLDLAKHQGRPLDLEAFLKLESWQFPPYHVGWPLQRAMQLMELFGISRQALQDYCRQVIENLTTGHDAFFRTDPPVSRQHVIERLNRP
jgi:hypothetical protein